MFSEDWVSKALVSQLFLAQYTAKSFGKAPSYRLAEIKTPLILPCMHCIDDKSSENLLYVAIE